MLRFGACASVHWRWRFYVFALLRALICADGHRQFMKFSCRFH